MYHGHFISHTLILLSTLRGMRNTVFLIKAAIYAYYLKINYSLLLFICCVELSCVYPESFVRP